MNDLRKQLMEIWKTCFGDSDEFIRFYFDLKYNEKNVVYKENEGKIISALHMLPYSMTWHNSEISVSYISGAATLPAMRGQGLMKNLLHTSFRIMLNRKIAATILIPAEKWLFDYYAECGYIPAFNYGLSIFRPQSVQTETITDNTIYEYPLSSAFNHGTITNKFTKRTIYSYFNRAMHKRDCCIQHSQTDFEANIRALYAEGGKIYISVTQKNRINGMAIVQSEPSRVLVKEIIAESDAVQLNMLKTIAQNWNTGEIIYKHPTLFSPSYPYGMIRVIDVLQMLTLFAAGHRDAKLTLHVTDPQLPENSGCYKLENGLCHKTDRSSFPDNYSLNIRQLTQVLFGYHTEKTGLPASLFPEQSPWMNLMLD